MIDRKQRLETRIKCEILPHKNDVVIKTVKMVDENGVISEQSTEVILDYTEIISKIPAYTTKIEYMELYGTLDKNNIVKYGFASPYQTINPQELVKKIIRQDLRIKKLNNNESTSQNGEIGE